MARIRMSAVALAYEVHAQFPALEIILHFTTRDRNLMGLQSDLLGCHALGLRNILCLTGDPPSLGDYPDATAVYDTDSMGLIRIVRQMNQGTDLAGNSIGASTAFAMGCGVNPTAEDLDLELDRFRRKLDAGAQFVMTQPVYELGAWERFLERLGREPGHPDPGGHPAAAVLPARRVPAQRGPRHPGAGLGPRADARGGQRGAAGGHRAGAASCSRAAAPARTAST